MIRATVPGLFGVGLGAVGALLAVSGESGGVWGGVWGGPGGENRGIWAILGRFWAILGRIRGNLGQIWGILGGGPGGVKKGSFWGGG